MVSEERNLTVQYVKMLRVVVAPDGGIWEQRPVLLVEGSQPLNQALVDLVSFAMPSRPKTNQ